MIFLSDGCRTLSTVSAAELYATAGTQAHRSAALDVQAMSSGHLLRDAVTAELLHEVGPPESWVTFDGGVAAVLSAASDSNLRQFLHLVTQIGARLGPLATGAVCTALRESSCFRSTSIAALAAATADETALLSVVETFRGSEELSYEMVCHEHTSIRVLASLPAHDVANLVSLGLYKSASSLSSANAFTTDVSSSYSVEVPQVMYAASLADSRLWTQEHLPWSFSTALAAISALMKEWGTDLVTLASIACTQGTSRVVDCAHRCVVEVCEALAKIFRDTSRTAAHLACALTNTLGFDSAVTAARAMS